MSDISQIVCLSVSAIYTGRRLVSHHYCVAQVPAGGPVAVILWAE
jgi:hypothetical protein